MPLVTRRRIPVHAPALNHLARDLAVRAIEAGAISGHVGYHVEEFEGRVAEYCRATYAVAVNSGTSALQLATIAANVKPGEQVLVSASTNIASAVGVVQQGGIVVPVDVDPDLWVVTPKELQACAVQVLPSEPHVLAVLVDLFGHPVDLPTDPDVYGRPMRVIEDMAQALGATRHGLRIGGQAWASCLSFYSNKVVTTGEGGMVLTNDAQVAARVRSLRNLAFGEPRFVHHEAAYNNRMTNVQAALGCGQMIDIAETISKKRAVAHAYRARLFDVPGLRLHTEATWAKSVFWMFGLVVMPEYGITRDQLRAKLDVHGIETRTMFCPMHWQPALTHAVKLVRACPVAEDLWENGLYLPSGVNLSEPDLDEICDVIRGARC